VFPVLGEPLDHVGVAHHGTPDSSLEIEAGMKWLPGARDHATAVRD